MVLHGHVFSGEAEVGLGYTRLDDHLLQELGIPLPAVWNNKETKESRHYPLLKGETIVAFYSSKLGFSLT